MKLNRTLAVALHRAMWTDMQIELGDNPTPNQRSEFKVAWILKYFPNENVIHYCFLCEYAHRCSACPIRWPGGHCARPDFSYISAPICDILALPEKDEKCADLPDDCKKYVAHDETAAVRAYYKYREELLSEASGIPGSASIEDHVKAIKEKAVKDADSNRYIYIAIKNFLAQESGLDHNKSVAEHISVIKEKAVEEYFKKNPGAKLVSMDVDNAFKQYAKEQKAPIFKELAAASGLSVDNWSITDHVKAIQERAKEQMEPYVKSSTLLVDTLNKYKDFLSDESGLDRNRPVGDHIKEICYDAFSDGRDYERERIMNKIGEMLNDKSAGTAKDS